MGLGARIRSGVLAGGGDHSSEANRSADEKLAARIHDVFSFGALPGAALQLLIDLADEAVGARDACSSGSESTRSFRIPGSGQLRCDDFLFVLALRDQLLHFVPDAFDHV